MVYRQQRLWYVPPVYLLRGIDSGATTEMGYRRRHKELPISVTSKSNMESNTDDEDPEKELAELLDVSGCAWFSKLMVLMFGFASLLIGSFLYNFPAAPINGNSFWDTDSLEYSVLLRYLVMKYVILLSLCGIIVVVFTSVCLAIRIKALSPSSVPARWRYMDLTNRPVLRELSWNLLLVSLIVGTVVFDCFILDGRGVLVYYFWEHSYSLD